MKDGDVLDARQAGKHLGLHEETMRRLARAKKIPAYKVGGVWRFNKSMLYRWAESQQISAGRRSVLVVDDEPDILAVIAQTLEPAGYEVTTVSRGAEALEFMRREVPAVVVLDLKLPDVSGAAVLKEIREKYGQVPVVIITGYPDSNLMAQALRYSPVTMLAKPFTPDQVLHAVRLVLGAERAGVEP